MSIDDPDFGTCPCRGSYERKWVEVRMTVNGRIIVLRDVPQGACPNCGSRVYKADTLEQIESVLRAQAVDPRLNRVSFLL